MKVSIVIPVYNEAERLAACLSALAEQTIKPYEVIVVDNNSTDGTRLVALSFPFVKLVSEKSQGVTHARTTGFNLAQGEIIGRIDADTILPINWVEKTLNIFSDPSVSAVSGAPHYYDFGLPEVADSIDRRLRSRLARKLGHENFLWGANMAVRRSSWQSVRSKLCHQAGIHEDFDLAIHLQAESLKVLYDPTLIANVSSRRIDTGLKDYVTYTLVSPGTYAAHNLKSRRHMYPVLIACWLGYLPGRCIYRAYDPQTGYFSLSKLFTSSSSRIDPSSNTV